MNHLHVHLTNYLKLRRGLGFKLHSAEMSLRSFIRFAEAKRVRFVTTKLALQWATQPPNAKRVQSGSRLATVRRFAEYLSTVDPRTEVPSPKLLPYPPPRSNFSIRLAFLKLEMKIGQRHLPFFNQRPMYYNIDKPTPIRNVDNIILT